MGGAFMFSGQGASTPNAAPDTAKPGVGGKAIGVVGSIGVFLSPHVSLAFEISLPERFDAMQELHYFFSSQYDNHHRDVILSGLFHLHYQPQRSLIRPLPLVWFVTGRRILAVRRQRPDKQERSEREPAGSFSVLLVCGASPSRDRLE